MTSEETNAILAGNSPLPFKSRTYWRTRQLEDHTLRQVHYFLKFAAKPPKQSSYYRVRRYLQTQHGIFRSADNVLMAPSSTDFSNTPRYVVPQQTLPTIVSVFHQQFGCLAATPLKTLIKRHFFAFDLDKAVHDCVSSCLACAAKKDKSHVIHPTSSVTPPKFFGEQFATDVIQREKQKILIVRETATSYTWGMLVRNEQVKTLESGLRKLFADIRPPNATRPAICRADNYPSFVSLAENKSLQDIGVTVDISNQANKNGNPVAERANREVHSSLVTILPLGGKITAEQLQTALAHLNSKPRWSTLSAVELWTGRDMISGESLIFEQEDIITEQAARREKTRPSDAKPIPVFLPGEIVFCNSERSKLKARDQLIVRENLGNGMYRLDRLKQTSGRITKAFLPARDLYKWSPPPNDQTVEPDHSLSTDSSDLAPSDIPEQSSETKSNSSVSPCSLTPTDTDVLPSTPPHITSRERQRPIPPAPGEASRYQLPFQPTPHYIPFVFHFEDETPYTSTEPTPENQDSSDFGTPLSGASPANSPEQPVLPRLPQPITRQRSSSYPPPAKKPGNTNDWSRRDHSSVRDHAAKQRPKRKTRAPVGITYDQNFKQTLTRNTKDDSTTSDE